MKDEPVKSSKQSFKVNFFFAVLDTATNSSSKRFVQMEDQSKHFEILYDMKKIDKRETCILRKMQ